MQRKQGMKMSKKGLFFSEIIEAIGKKEEESYLKESERIQKKITLNHIKPPKSLDKKICQMIAGENKRQKQKAISLKIAIFLLVFIIGCQTIYIANPKIAMAVRYYISELFSFQSEKSLDVHLQKSESFWNHYKFDVPSDFELLPSDTSAAFHVDEHIYQNENGEYIRFDIYPENFLVSIDTEKCKSLEDIYIKEYSAKCITKNGITTILILIDDKLLEVESSLPADEVKEIVESIDTNE